MNFDALSPELKRRVLAAEGKQPKAPKDRRSVKERGLPLTCVGTHGCGAVLEDPSESALQTHYKRGCRSTRFEWRVS